MEKQNRLIGTYKIIGTFLLKNGFVRIEPNSFANDLCNVRIETDYFAVANNNGDTIYSSDLNIYWLLGVLLWHEYIDNFNK